MPYLAISRPIPLPPPVISATLPCKISGRKGEAKELEAILPESSAVHSLLKLCVRPFADTSRLQSTCGTYTMIIIEQVASRKIEPFGHVMLKRLIILEIYYQFGK